MNTFKKLFPLIILIFPVFAPCQSLSRIERMISKQDYTKGRELVLKSLEKDSVNAGAKYYYSILFLQDSAKADTDSARIYINSALLDYSIASEDDLKELGKAEISQEKLEVQKRSVTDTAYREATGKMTVRAMDDFLLYYPDAAQKARAVFIRDSLAYELAGKQHTWQAYKHYMDMYPGSYHFGQAKENYQVLVYKDKTRDDRLESYVSFLKQYPETPFRPGIEEIIFRRSTLDHAWQSYVRFLEDYPASHLRKKVTDILYYIDKTKKHSRLEQVLNLHPHADSLRSINLLEGEVLYPVWVEQQYGFSSLGGLILIPPRFQGISSDYYCGNITSEWLQILQDGQHYAVSRTGDKIIGTPIASFTDLGSGVVLVDFGDFQKLYHKSGFRISDRHIEEAEILGKRWIRYLADGLWGLMALTGEIVLEAKYSAIEQTGPFLVLEQDDAFTFTTPEKLIENHKGDFEARTGYDDYELVSDSLLLVFRGDQECLFDANLSMVIPLGEHEIFTFNAAWYIKKADGYQIYNRHQDELINQVFPYLEVNNGWLGIHRADDWLLISQYYKLLPVRGLDSIRLINEYAAFIKKGDSLQVIFQSGKREWLQENERLVTLTPGTYRSDSSRQFLLFASSGDYKKVLNESGSVVLEGKYESITCLTDTLFKVQQKGKTGIVSSRGEVILKPEYEVVDEKDGMVFLLKDGKIGCYDIQNKYLLPAVYQTRIERLGKYYQVTKEGRKGLVNGENQEILTAEFEELMPWNDSSVWAKKENFWQLRSIPDSEVLIGNVRELTPVAVTGEERFYITLRDQAYGLVSNQSGVLLAPQYNDIVNVGSPDEPVFFAEQHLEAAAFFIVTYFNKKGEAIRSQAFRPGEYENIYCDQ